MQLLSCCYFNSTCCQFSFALLTPFPSASNVFLSETVASYVPFSIFSFALVARRQGYKNCLVLKAFYATLCALLLRLLRLLVWRVVVMAAFAACLSPSTLHLPQTLLTSLSHLLAHASHTLFVLPTPLPLPLSLCFFCLYFIIIIFRVILCFARQFLWKNSTFTFCFLLCICLLSLVYVCVCVFDFEHFL